MCVKLGLQFRGSVLGRQDHRQDQIRRQAIGSKKIKQRTGIDEAVKAI
jgi:hypothetical protein